MRVIALFFMIGPFLAYAQEPASAPSTPRLPYTLKSTPLNWLNPLQQSLGLLADLPLSRRWSAEVGVDWVLESESFATYAGEKYRGYKLKPAIKYYTRFKGRNHYYICLALKYGNIQNQQYINLLRQGGQYTEWVLQHRRFETWGFAFRYGNLHYMGKRRRLMIEPFIALGVRHLNISRDAIPLDAEVVPERVFISLERQPGIYNVGDFLMGFHFGWVLKS